MEWQDISTIPKVDPTNQFHDCDVWAETFILADAKTGSVRKVSKRFPGCRRFWRPETSGQSGLLTSSPIKWENGPPDGWNITHWMPLPPSPQQQEMK